MRNTTNYIDDRNIGATNLGQINRKIQEFGNFLRVQGGRRPRASSAPVSYEIVFEATKVFITTDNNLFHSYLSFTNFCACKWYVCSLPVSSFC